MSLATAVPAPDRVRQVGANVLVGLLLLRFTAVLLGDGVTYGILRLTGTPDAWRWAVLASDVHVSVIADVATITIVALLLRREGRRLRDLLRPAGVVGTAWRTVVVLVALYVAFAVGGVLGGLLTGPAGPSGAPVRIPLWFGLWTLIVLPATVAIAEEYLYRGFLQPHLAARIGTPAAVVVVAAAFALQHVGMVAVSWDAVIVKLAATFVAGLALGLLYLRMRRLLPLILGHWLLDVLGIGLPVFLLALRA